MSAKTAKKQQNIPKKTEKPSKAKAKTASAGTVAKKALKPKVPKAKPELLPEEENLKKFMKTPLAMTFVKKMQGCWNHQDWVEFICKVKKGYDPIDADSVGLILEEKKIIFFTSKKD